MRAPSNLPLRPPHSAVTRLARATGAPAGGRLNGGVGVYPLTVLWPAGWAWHSGRSEYLEMIIAIYATLGVFLIIASRNPNDHLSLISFTIWSSIVHGAVMTVQAVLNTQHLRHLYGDVLALFVIAAVLGFLSPEALRLRFGRHAAQPAPAVGAHEAQVARR